LGCLAGATTGLFFHQENWLHGYNSWERRMTRLAHISFFGLGFINFMYGMTCLYLNLKFTPDYSAYLLICGAITMPIVCYLSAFRKFFRHLFFIPVVSILSGILFFFWQVGKL